MGAWKGLYPWLDGDPLLASQFANNINANLDYLLKPNSFYVYDVGTYTTTSTSYVNVNATFSRSLTVYGGHILVGVQAWIDGASITDLAIGIDGGSENIILRRNASTGTAVAAGCRLLTGVAAGAHTLALRWRVPGGGTGTMRGADNAGVAYPPIIFWGIEI